MTQKFKRYDCTSDDRIRGYDSYGPPIMKDDPEGEYVLYSDYQKLQEQLGKAESVLNKAINAADFFSRHADCRKDSWACKCEFCRDTTSTKNLNDARQYFKEKESK